MKINEMLFIIKSN